jgi:hypothetical protein
MLMPAQDGYWSNKPLAESHGTQTAETTYYFFSES